MANGFNVIQIGGDLFQIRFGYFSVMTYQLLEHIGDRKTHIDCTKRLVVSALHVPTFDSENKMYQQIAGRMP